MPKANKPIRQMLFKMVSLKMLFECIRAVAGTESTK